LLLQRHNYKESGLPRAFQGPAPSVRRLSQPLDGLLLSIVYLPYFIQVPLMKFKEPTTLQVTVLSPLASQKRVHAAVVRYDASDTSRVTQPDRADTEP
jgi:hypothetical protein